MLFLSLAIAPIVQASYLPPKHPPAPKDTVPRISRGGCSADAAGGLTALAPVSHVGQTIAKRPTVAWYIPERESYPLQFRLFSSSGQLIYRTVLQSQPGIMTFALPAKQPELPNGQYRWQIVLLCDPNTPSLNVVTAAELSVVTPPADLKAQLATASTPQQRSDRYAQNGFWYDALSAAFQGSDKAQQQAITLALLDALVQVEAPTAKAWSDRLRQIEAIERQRFKLR